MVLTDRGRVVITLFVSAVVGVSVLVWAAWRDHRIDAQLPECKTIEQHKYDARFMDEQHKKWYSFQSRDGSWIVYCR